MLLKKRIDQYFSKGHGEEANKSECFWEYKSANSWVKFDATITHSLEQKFLEGEGKGRKKKKRKVSFKSQDDSEYEIDLRTLTQTNLKTGNVRPVRRRRRTLVRSLVEGVPRQSYQVDCPAAWCKFQGKGVLGDFGWMITNSKYTGDAYVHPATLKSRRSNKPGRRGASIINGKFGAFPITTGHDYGLENKWAELTEEVKKIIDEDILVVKQARESGQFRRIWFLKSSDGFAAYGSHEHGYSVTHPVRKYVHEQIVHNFFIADPAGGVSPSSKLEDRFIINIKYPPGIAGRGLHETKAWVIHDTTTANDLIQQALRKVGESRHKEKVDPENFALMVENGMETMFGDKLLMDFKSLREAVHAHNFSVALIQIKMSEHEEEVLARASSLRKIEDSIRQELQKGNKLTTVDLKMKYGDAIDVAQLKDIYTKASNEMKAQTVLSKADMIEDEIRLSFSEAEQIPDIADVPSQDPIEYEGWMQKQGKSWGSWKSRYCKLSTKKIFRYYKDNSCKHLVKEVSMRDITSITRLEYKPGRFNIITPNRFWKFRADPNEVAQWVNAFSKNLNFTVFVKPNSDLPAMKQINSETFDIEPFWDRLLDEIAEGSVATQDESLNQLWMYYDRSKKDWIGKPELRRFLSDWITAIDRNYDIEEILIEHFEQSISERALQAKLFLDTRHRGRVSKKDFVKIWKPEFWQCISYEVHVDPKENAVAMWLDLFQVLDYAGFLGDDEIQILWERYEIEEKGSMCISNFETMLLDWISAYNVHYAADEVEQTDVQYFMQTVNMRAALAKSFLDQNADGIVDWEEFRNISDAEFWNIIDFQYQLDEQEENYRRAFTLESEHYEQSMGELPSGSDDLSSEAFIDGDEFDEEGSEPSESFFDYR